MNVPKKANDAMHLSMLDGLEESLEALGDVLLQVWHCYLSSLWSVWETVAPFTFYCSACVWVYVRV